MRPATMRAVLMPGDRRVVVVDRAVPAPGEGEVLVRTRASAICRSDMSIYYGDPVLGDVRTGDNLRVPGHEAAGDVVAIGPGVTSVRIGDRVAGYLAVGDDRGSLGALGYLMLTPGWRCFGFDIDGGDADYFVLPEANCLPLPDWLSYEAGAVMTDMVGTQYFTQERLDVKDGETVAVLGLGPMGLAATMIAKAKGAVVVAGDILPSRQERASRLGADFIIDTSSETIEDLLRQTYGPRTVDVVVECSGNPLAQRQALDVVGNLGRVAFVGESPAVEISPSEHMIHKQVTLIGAWYFPLPAWEEIVAFVKEHRVDPALLISHRFSIESAAEAFQAFDEKLTEKAVFVW